MFWERPSYAKGKIGWQLDFSPFFRWNRGFGLQNADFGGEFPVFPLKSGVFALKIRKIALEFPNFVPSDGKFALEIQKFALEFWKIALEISKFDPEFAKIEGEIHNQGDENSDFNDEPRACEASFLPFHSSKTQ